MNTIIETIKKRRSTKKYDGRPVAEDVLDAVLDAGLYAPCGQGKQAAIMVCVTDKAARDKLSEMNARILGTDTDPFYGAPAVVVVFADSTVATAVEDGSLVIGTMSLAAESLGLGACWIHRARQMFETEEGRKLMNDWGVGSEYIGVGCCALGYAAGSARPAAPRKPGRIIKIN